MTVLAHTQLPPSPQDAATARSSSEVLSRHARQKEALALRVADGTDAGSAIELPAGVVTLLVDILEAMAEGRGVTVMPEDAELTTVQAAALLNVSRPFLVKLLDEGALPYRMVGRHRRMRAEDVVAYKAAIDRDREAVLDRLAREAQEQDMGYNRP